MPQIEKSTTGRFSAKECSVILLNRGILAIQANLYYFHKLLHIMSYSLYMDQVLNLNYLDFHFFIFKTKQ